MGASQESFDGQVSMSLKNSNIGSGRLVVHTFAW